MKSNRIHPVAPKRRIGKRIWVTVRQPLARSPVVNYLLPRLISAFIRLTYRTNPITIGSSDPLAIFLQNSPVIIAIWHGQHLTVPALKTLTDKPVVALFSRSADAEMNARVAARMGLEIVRGSGGRAGIDAVSKGGVSALLALRRALAGGKTVAMIADIAKGKPRDSGMGIVTLARASGRPILPIAYATSRRYVLEGSWDKTTINLPFGRGAVICADLVYVPADADEAIMEEKRREVTKGLNAATKAAYALLDGQS
jgi:lysophospholipid acyltransferase (LPLAT)-like uncharacterized protein